MPVLHFSLISYIFELEGHTSVGYMIVGNTSDQLYAVTGGSLVDALRMLEGKLLPVDQVCAIMYQTSKAVQHMQVSVCISDWTTLKLGTHPHTLKVVNVKNGAQE